MTGSSQWDDNFRPSDAGDGRVETRWNAAATGRAGGDWLVLDLGSEQSFNQASFRQFEERITQYRIQYWDGTQWADAYRGGPMKSYQLESFPEVKAAKVRLLVEETNGKEPSILNFRSAARAKPAAGHPRLPERVINARPVMGMTERPEF